MRALKITTLDSFCHVVSVSDACYLNLKKKSLNRFVTEGIDVSLFTSAHW